MVTRKVFGQLAEVILEGGAKTATKYLGPKEVIKATRRGKRDKRDRTVEILFTIGKPNYAERNFIRRAMAAGEPFPVKKIQLRFKDFRPDDILVTPAR